VVVFVDEHDDQLSFLQRVLPVLPAGAQLHLVHVVNPMVDASDRFALSNAEALAGLTAEWQARLDALAAEVPGATTAVENVQRGEDIGPGLLRVAAEADAGLLALGTRRAGTMRGMILGSVADAVMREARMPVLVVHVE
jgi:nucleotide-binding universal stress UspA family protein